MPHIDINILAVLVAAITAFALGGLWYGPFFGKAWAQLLGWTPEKMEAMKKDPQFKKHMSKAYALQFVNSVVMALVLSILVGFVLYYTVNLEGSASTVAVGLVTGFLVWLGFISTTFMGKVLWEDKPWKLYAIDAGYYLVSLILMGIIVSIWR